MASNPSTGSAGNTGSVVGSVVQSIGGRSQADAAAQESADTPTPPNIRTQAQQDEIDAQMERRGLTPTGPGSATIVGGTAAAAGTGASVAPSTGNTNAPAAPSAGTSVSAGNTSGSASSSTSGGATPTP